MAKEKKRILFVGIAYEGETLLLLPKPGGYDLPLLERKRFAKKKLLIDLEELGFEEPTLLARLERIDYRLGEEDVILEPVVFGYVKMKQPYLTYPVHNAKAPAPELVSLFLWRADVYGPYYRQEKRTVPLLEPERKKVEKELACLEAHANLLGKGVLGEFRSLCESASSIRRINEAFVRICNTYHINPNRIPDNTQGKKKATR